jgi:CxxC motif-containing protein
MEKELLCIVCPTGCRINARQENGEITIVGNQCKRGADFAQAELTNPMRTLTTTVRTVFPGVPVLPVRTAGEIPKGAVPAALSQLAKYMVQSRLACGEVIIEDLAGTGCPVIATSNILADIDIAIDQLPALR